MSVYKYPKFKIVIDPESKKVQGLRTGDVVRRQYNDGSKLIYSLMVVLSTGIDLIGESESAYFIGALIEGDEPGNGELLDFVRVTNLFDVDRSGALYMTAGDSHAPYLDVIDRLATDNSLCYPLLDGGSPDIAGPGKYACYGNEFVDAQFIHQDSGVFRIYRLTRNTVIGNISTGIKQSITKRPLHPQRILISYKARGSKELTSIPFNFGYTNGNAFDGEGSIDVTTTWTYYLHAVTIDYPAQYQRSFTIELSDYLTDAGAWFEIAELNIVLQSDISTFSNSTKARVGKIKGINDPIFGVLEGYGAYFQNMYATRNVNIAGTLTAGDENGFSSTFYVGRIHKNVIRNSITGDFNDTKTKTVEDKAPVGIGNVWEIEGICRMKVQSAEWRDRHLGQKYCYSIWLKPGSAGIIQFYQNEFPVINIPVDGTGDWERLNIPFIIKDSEESDLIIGIETTLVGLRITAPQLEYGGSSSQYQPTDGTLSYVEDYGAWFNKGGIGGTIQNPLLKLNEDGSISSKDNSFVIRPDGTGHFAGGRFTWNKDTIVLQDVTIRWEDLDDKAKENLSPVTLEIRSKQGFSIINGQNNVTASAVLVKGGMEIDSSGLLYSYHWQLWNPAGTSVIKTYEGKIITVPASEVDSYGVLECQVLSG